MQTNPPKADAPKRKRRGFQFSLRTLMIGVTLLAVIAATIRVIGPPWIIDSSAGGPPTHDWSISCLWLIVVATEFYVAWMVMRFARARPQKQFANPDDGPSTP